MKLTDEKIDETWDNTPSLLGSKARIRDFARAIESELAQASEPDNCDICRGAKGGVKGNENLIGGKRVCDYCHAQASEPVAWRDVSDELPTEAQEVLFVRDNKVLYGAWIGGIFWHSNTKMAAAKWMPLPSVDLDTTPQPASCPRCDGTGDVSNQIGEYLGHCDCGAPSQFKAEMQEITITELQERCAEWGTAWDELNESTGKTITELQARCADLEQFRFRLCDMRSADVAALQTKLTAAEQQIASDKLLLDEAETALQQVPDGWRHLGIPKILAKLKNRGA